MDQANHAKSSDVYQRVTAEIIKAIEDGVEGAYRMPWHRHTAEGFPKNVISRRPYHGLNTLALWSTTQMRGYHSSFWATYRQWTTLHAQVRKGEKATAILFYKEDDRTREAEQEEEQGKRRVIARSSFVFNAAQVDGYDWQGTVLVPEDRTVRLDRAEHFVSGIGAQVVYGGERAFYRPSTDHIQMPERASFIGTTTSSATESFYAVLLHEHVHWSGHSSRLDRNLSGRFGQSAYAMEELIAELGAAFLCAELGVANEPREDHALYVKSWLPVLKEKKLALVSAASAATKACRYLVERSTPAEQVA
ncbi:MAG: zincin-like metallopeptidase domain-containing protein [Candidatus Accumulibacter sp. UW20]|jgi:antirestriction protein ArdC